MRRASAMRRSALLCSNTISTPTHKCLACRQTTALFSTSIQQAEKKAFSERLRSKIWGTDNPPGQKDPYAAKGTEVNMPTEPAANHAQMLKDYVPATTWEGLYTVGGEDVWEPRRPFVGWTPTTKLTESHELTCALRRAVIEILVLQSTNQPLDVSLGVNANATKKIRIVPSAGKKAVLKFSKGATSGLVLDSLRVQTSAVHNEAAEAAEEEEVEHALGEPTESEEDVNADRSTEDPLEKVRSEAEVASWNPVWLQISLEDAKFKFAVLKRMMQLTGVRLPDSALNNVATVQDVLTQVITPPKPRTVIESLSQKEHLLNLPNVTISSRRVTPIDKEVSLGRWKVIEKELEHRELPIVGRS